MSLKVDSFHAAGSLRVTGSKSYTQRALAAALLAGGETVIDFPSLSSDALHALGIIRGLGADVVQTGPSFRVTGGFNPKMDELQCGESGLALRMFSAVAALHHAPLTLKASGSLRNRPADMICAPLEQLGAGCSTSQGFPPVMVRGPLRGGKARMDGSRSSQFLSGLLMALPLAEQDSVLEVDNLKSRPYVDMTLEVLRHFGIRVEHEDYSFFRIEGKQKYSPVRCPVEGDWSGGAFFLVAGALAGPVEVEGLNPESLQADRAILEVLEKTGACVSVEKHTIRVSHEKINAFSFDATHCPDLFPPLVVLAAHATGTSRIQGAGRLTAKESDRAKVLQEEFSALGVEIGFEGDVMLVSAGKRCYGCVDPHGDHRIAMAAAMMAAGGGPGVEILDPGCVNKSYPEFFDHIQQIGGKTL